MSEVKNETSRGFAIKSFVDLYGAGYSIQKSSLASQNSIWFGVDDAYPQVLASEARSLGVITNERTGWVRYPIPPQVLMTTRMHLSQEQVRELLPILQKFVDTGEV